MTRKPLPKLSPWLKDIYTRLGKPSEFSLHTPGESAYSTRLYAGILPYVSHHFDVILRPLRFCVPQQTTSGIFTLR